MRVCVCFQLLLAHTSEVPVYCFNHRPINDLYTARSMVNSQLTSFLIHYSCTHMIFPTSLTYTRVSFLLVFPLASILNLNMFELLRNKLSNFISSHSPDGFKCHLHVDNSHIHIFILDSLSGFQNAV